MKVTGFTVLTGAALFASAVFAPARANLVINGGFEAGNTGFTSNYLYQANLVPEGTYNIGCNANSYHLSFSGGPQSGSNFMIINGATTDGTVAWEENGITVDPNTTYYFSAWVTSVYPASPAVLSFSINNTPIGGSVSPTSTVGEQHRGRWQRFRS